MLKFKVKDSNKVIYGDSSEEIIKGLNEQSLFGYNEDLMVFIKETSEAIKTQYGIEVKYDNYDNFVLGLIGAGLLIEDCSENIV